MKFNFSNLTIVAALMLACLCPSKNGFAAESSDVVIRAALDIGSGATKLRVAEINTKTQKIEKVLVNVSIAVPYQEKLELSKDQAFDEELIEEGLNAIKDSLRIANEFHAEKMVGIATASFRKAVNAQDFIERIKRETGVEVHIIDQGLEGELAFEAVKSQVDVAPENLVVWDIGGGSLQLTTMDKDGSLQVYRSVEASVPFKNYIIQNIQLRNIAEQRTPNPMDHRDMQQAEHKAKRIAAKVDTYFKEKVSNPQNLVVGVGNIFSIRIQPLVDNKVSFSLAELASKVSELAHLSDEDVGNDSFANVGISNPILILGYMKQLGIQNMEILDVNNADGAMLFPPFWE